MKPWQVVAIALVMLQEDGPSSIRIAAEDEPGTRMTVTGKVLDLAGRPVRGVKLHVYHTDAAGLYQRPGQSGHRLQGDVWTDRSGRFEFRTIRPAPYPGARSGEHFHLLLSGGGIRDHRALIEFREDQPVKLIVSVGAGQEPFRRYTGFAWKKDDKTGGQLLDVTLRVTR